MKNFRSGQVWMSVSRVDVVYLLLDELDVDLYRTINIVSDNINTEGHLATNEIEDDADWKRLS